MDFAIALPWRQIRRTLDGDNSFNGVDFKSGRNHFIAPPFINADVRVAKRFDFGERIRLHAYLEFFNLLNRANPAAVNSLPPAGAGSNVPKFGQVLQVLSGREGQLGLQIEFLITRMSGERSGAGLKLAAGFSALFCSATLGYLFGIRQGQTNTGAVEKTYHLNFWQLNLHLLGGSVRRSCDVCIDRFALDCGSSHHYFK